MSKDNCTVSHDTNSTQNSDILYLSVPSANEPAIFSVDNNILEIKADACKSNTTMQPIPSIPFSRLAGFNEIIDGAPIIYHQLNATAFVQHNWRQEAGIWHTFINPIETA